MKAIRKMSICTLFLVVLVMPLLAQEIHDAARQGDIAKIETLLTKNPELVNARDNRDCRPLHFAVNEGHQKMVELLLAKGADIHAKDVDGDEPIHWAAYAGRTEVAALLLRKGAKINARNNNGGTPLDWAIEREHDETAKFLLSKGGIETPIVDPEVHQLSKNIHRITFPYSMRTNIGVSTGDDGILLVDTGFSRRAIGKIKATLQKLGKGDLKYIINTHLHGDHVAANEIGGDQVTRINYENLEKLVTEGIISEANRPIRGGTDKIFETYYTMSFNGEEIRLIPYPGVHSDADVIIHFTGSGVVHMGDLLLSQSFPAVGGRVVEYLELLATVIDVFPENTTYISGHGRDYTLNEVRNYQKMLLTTVEIVKDGMKAGKTVEEMRKEKLLKDYESWGEFLTFLNTNYWIDAIYQSYKDKLGG